MSNQQTKLTIDYTLIFLVIILMGMSVFTLYTVTPFLPAKYADINFPFKQFLWYIIGGILIFLIMLLDYDRFRKITWIIYAVGILPLLMIFFRFPGSLMVEFNNIVRGISFPLLGNIQPAEFFKIVYILVVAHVMVSHNQKYLRRTAKSDLWLLLKVALLAVLPMGMIGLQPDLGSVLVLVSITACMILVSGIRLRCIGSVFLASLAGIGLTIAAWSFLPSKISTFLEDSVFKHVTGRFYGWLYPDQYLGSGHQVKRSMSAIGSGQLSGKGMSQIEVSVPEKHTDMIFSAIGEQFGFIGVSILLLVYFLLIYRLLHIALSSNDMYGSYLVTGVIGMFTYQIFQNIGMSIQLLPITGLPLPFLSYGGSSVLTCMLGIALALNVHSRTKTYMFGE